MAFWDNIFKRNIKEKNLISELNKRNKYLENLLIDSGVDEALLYGRTDFNRKDYLSKMSSLISHVNLGTPTASYIAQFYKTIYGQITRDKEIIVRKVNEISNFYLVQAIINQLTNDICSPDINNDNEILEVFYDDDSYEGKNINSILKDFDAKFNIDAFVMDICKDALLYGDYITRNKIVEGKGIVEIYDDVEQNKIIPLISYSNIDGYLILDDNSKKLILDSPGSYTHFSINPTKMKVQFLNKNKYQHIVLNRNTDEDIDELFSSLPNYIRVGESIIYPVFDKLQELQMLELLVPATALNNINNSNIIGESVPAGYSPEKAKEACQISEDLLNPTVTVNKILDTLSLSNVLQTAGRYRVIPVYGDNKGSLSRMNLSDSNQLDTIIRSIDSSRKIILETIGIPSELIYGSLQSRDKSEFLRRYARYLTLIRSIRSSLSSGVKQLIYTHLSNIGVSYRREKVKVQFASNLLDVNNLDELEFLDTSVSYMQNFKRFVADLKDSGYSVNDNVVVEWFNENLDKVGLSDLISKNKKQVLEPEKNNISPVYTGNNTEKTVDNNINDNNDNSKDITKEDGKEITYYEKSSKTVGDKNEI